MQAAGDTKTMPVQPAMLRAVCGQATLENLAKWQQALIITLASKGHATHTAYARADIDVNAMRIIDTSPEALRQKFPTYGEVDQEALKRTMCAAHDITTADMELEENAEIRTAIKRAMAARLLAYEE